MSSENDIPHSSEDNSSDGRKSLSKNLDMDQCLEYVNPKGRYQILLFIVLLIQGTVGSYIFVGGPYYFEDPIFICQDGSECKQKDACDQGGYTISPNSHKTLTLEFELYCDRQYLKNLSMSFVFVGSLVGTFLFSFLSDLKGRKLAMMCSWLFCVLGAGIFAFPSNVPMIIIGLFFGGMGIYPASTLAFIVLSEQSIGKFRKITTGFLLLGFTLSEGFINLLGYIFDNNWRTLIRYFFFIPLILLQFTMFYIIESPRFYLNKQNSKVVESLNAIAKRNAPKSEPNKGQMTIDQIDFLKYAVKGKKTIYTYMTLLRYKSIRWTTIACSIMKFLMIFANFGMQFSISAIGFNMYMNATMGFIAEMLTYLFLGKVLNSVKRKPAALFFQASSCLFCLLFIAFPIPDSCTDGSCYQKVFQIILYFFARITSSSYFVVISTYFPELYPTSVRSLGVGFIRATGISGSILSSFAVTWSEDIGISPLVSFGIIGSFSCFFGFYLQETQHQPLKDEIEEVKLRETLLEEQEKNQDFNFQQTES